MLDRRETLKTILGSVFLTPTNINNVIDTNENRYTNTVAEPLPSVSNKTDMIILMAYAFNFKNNTLLRNFNFFLVTDAGNIRLPNIYEITQKDGNIVINFGDIELNQTARFKEYVCIYNGYRHILGLSTGYLAEPGDICRLNYTISLW